MRGWSQIIPRQTLSSKYCIKSQRVQLSKPLIAFCHCQVQGQGSKVRWQRFHHFLQRSFPAPAQCSLTNWSLHFNMNKKRIAYDCDRSVKWELWFLTLIIKWIVSNRQYKRIQASCKMSEHTIHVITALIWTPTFITFHYFMSHVTFHVVIQL